MVIYAPDYIWLHNSIAGYRQKVIDLNQSHDIRNAVDSVRLVQLNEFSEIRRKQDSINFALELKLKRYAGITNSYKSLIAKRDSVYAITEDRFIKQIEFEKRKPKGFWNKIKDKLVYLAVGVLAGFTLR